MRHTESNSNHAAVLALGALEYLASNEAHFSRFLRLTGLSLDAVRASASEASFHASVLDYMLQDEPLLLEWCEAAGHHAGEVLQARRKLPGFLPF